VVLAAAVAGLQRRAMPVWMRSDVGGGDGGSNGGMGGALAARSNGGMGPGRGPTGPQNAAARRRHYSADDGAYDKVKKEARQPISRRTSIGGAGKEIAIVVMILPTSLNVHYPLSGNPGAVSSVNGVKRNAPGQVVARGGGGRGGSGRRYEGSKRNCLYYPTILTDGICLWFRVVVVGLEVEGQPAEVVGIMQRHHQVGPRTRKVMEGEQRPPGENLSTVMWHGKKAGWTSN